MSTWDALGNESLTTLMMVHIMWYMPTARRHSLICSASPLGYRALKEMLQNGVPGTTLLIEGSDPLTPFSLVYTTRAVNKNKGDYIMLSNGYQGEIRDDAKAVSIFSNLKILPINLLKDCRTLEDVDLSHIEPNRAVEVEEYFLTGCSSLASLDLTPLSWVTTINQSFLQGCTGFIALDLTPLSNVTVVGSAFLRGCSGLTSIDLGPLSKVAVVDTFFLDGCSALTTLDLRPLSNVGEIRNFFLHGCCRLTTLDLKPLANIKEIPGFFLNACFGLKTLDFRPLAHVKVIRTWFLTGCTGLTVVDLRPFLQLEKVPESLQAEFGGSSTIVMLPNHHLNVGPLGEEKELP